MIFGRIFLGSVFSICMTLALSGCDRPSENTPYWSGSVDIENEDPVFFHNGIVDCAKGFGWSLTYGNPRSGSYVFILRKRRYEIFISNPFNTHVYQLPAYRAKNVKNISRAAMDAETSDILRCIAANRRLTSFPPHSIPNSNR
jgi:hypothetical protein